jgi:hypothetical protein
MLFLRSSYLNACNYFGLRFCDFTIERSYGGKVKCDFGTERWVREVGRWDF